MSERMFNGALVTSMGLDAMAATRASIRQSVASRQALRQANAHLASATDRLDAAQARLARAKALRASRA